MGKEANGDGCLALGDVHAHAVALLARNLPFGLDLLGNELEVSLGECSASRPRIVEHEAFCYLYRKLMIWVARPWMVCLDEPHGWLQDEMASGCGRRLGGDIFNAAGVSNSGTDRRLCLAMACGQISQQKSVSGVMAACREDCDR